MIYQKHGLDRHQLTEAESLVFPSVVSVTSVVEFGISSRVDPWLGNRGGGEIGEAFQAEGEADAAVVAVGAEDAGEAVVPAAAADLDRPVGRRRGDLEDHLRVEPQAPAEPQVELDALGGDSILAERPRQLPERSDGLGGRLGEVPVEPFKDRTPLWAYVLIEAKLNGGRLGTVGTRIVAETLMTLVRRFSATKSKT